MLELVPEFKQPLIWVAMAASIVLVYLGGWIMITTAVLFPILTCCYVSAYIPAEDLWSKTTPAPAADLLQEGERSRRPSDEQDSKKPARKGSSGSEGKRTGSKESAEKNDNPKELTPWEKLQKKLRKIEKKERRAEKPQSRKVGGIHAKQPLGPQIEEVTDIEEAAIKRKMEGNAEAARHSQDASEAGDDEDVELPPRTKDSCRNCWLFGKSICRRCNKIKYCSKNCQREHWAVHKQFCGKDDAALRQMWSMMWPECSASQGDMTKHREFVEHVGGNFWCTDNGWRVLHSLVSLSAILRQFKTEEVLLDFIGLIQDVCDLGADVNAKCDTGDTPLHMAFKDGTDQGLVIARFLLEFTAVDLTLRNNAGQTAEDLCRSEDCKVLIARTRGELEVEATLKLEEKDRLKAEEREKEKDKKPPSPPSRRDSCRECSKPGRLICRRCNKVKYCCQECQKKNWLVHKRFCGKELKDLNTLWNDLCSACMEHKGDTTDLRYFVQHVGGDFRVDPEGGWEVLHYLTVLSHILSKYKNTDARGDFIALLIDTCEYGADVNAQTKLGDTPLHMACHRDDGEGKLMAKILLEHAPVDTRVRNKIGRTARESCKDEDTWALFATKEAEGKQATARELSEKQRAIATASAVKDDELSSLSDGSSHGGDEKSITWPMVM